MRFSERMEISASCLALISAVNPDRVLPRPIAAHWDHQILMPARIQTLLDWSFDHHASAGQIHKGRPEYQTARFLAPTGVLQCSGENCNGFLGTLSQHEPNRSQPRLGGIEGLFRRSSNHRSGHGRGMIAHRCVPYFCKAIPLYLPCCPVVFTVIIHTTG